MGDTSPLIDDVINDHVILNAQDFNDPFGHPWLDQVNVDLARVNLKWVITDTSLLIDDVINDHVILNAQDFNDPFGHPWLDQVNVDLARVNLNG